MYFAHRSKGCGIAELLENLFKVFIHFRFYVSTFRSRIVADQHSVINGLNHDVSAVIDFIYFWLYRFIF